MMYTNYKIAYNTKKQNYNKINKKQKVAKIINKIDI